MARQYWAMDDTGGSELQILQKTGISRVAITHKVEVMYRSFNEAHIRQLHTLKLLP